MIAALLLLVVAFGVAVATTDPAGVGRGVAFAGLAAFIACAGLRAVRVYSAGTPAALPGRIGHAQIRIRRARAFTALAIGLALVLPVAAMLALLALVAWSWMPVGGLLALGSMAAFLRVDAADRRPYWWPSDIASGLVDLLCMRADIPAPEVVVEHGPVATAWTAGGRIHVTKRLVDLLDDAELEAVLAHEVAHLARRDAAVMEICSAPGHVLLGFARVIVPWARAVIREGLIDPGFAMVTLGVLCGPPAVVIGSISRLSTLGLSRARELGADAIAATLTGRPSALASALMKLDAQSERIPFVDLRQLEPDPVLCIVAPVRSRLRGLLSTHPPTAARIRRLQRIESTIHAHARLDPGSW